MKLKGQIEIDSDKNTVTVRLDNGSYCLDYYTHGMKRFLDEEIELLHHKLDHLASGVAYINKPYEEE